MTDIDLRSMPSQEEDLIRQSPLFDEAWYLESYPDVSLARIDPARHYLRYGARLGRDPGPDFSTRHYLEANPDVARAGVNPLLHFERSGRTEGRAIRPLRTEPAPAPVGPVSEPGPAKAVDVIVPVHNALDDVRSCLVALATAKTGFELRVLVVNDGSDTATSAWLRRVPALLSAPGVAFELIEHDINRGYTMAVNSGLRASDAPYVVTLNSDTIVTSGWLDGLVRCLDSAPEIGIVGPLSNAATWQNVPDLHDDTGAHAINALPRGMTPEDMARLVQEVSLRLYPRTTFVNGFCFLTARAVLDAVGEMDEEAFPTGYGEENDFCIRAMDAGFALAYADDVYVYHAKSKSFGTERRLALSKAGGEALRRKHGAEKFARLVHEVQKTAEMDAVRAQVQAGLARRSADSVVGHDAMRLLPGAVFTPRGYRIDPGFSGPALVLPFEGAAGVVPAPDIGIHLHLHYPELLDEFAGFLAHVPVPFHLYVSVPLDADVTAIEQRLRDALPRARIRVEAFVNRGRDIGPFLAGFGRALSRHDYIAHIHSKRSPHNPAKKDWRLQLMTNLMGSEALVAEILRLFEQTPGLGMVFPEYHWSLETQISWGTNYAICQDLAARLDMAVSPVHMAPFPAGSMFWARRAALAPLFDLDLAFEDFPEEDGQVDGTLAHAVERLFGNIVLQTGHDLRQVRSAKPHDLQSYYTAAWPYPARPAEEQRARAERYRAERRTAEPLMGLLSANAGGYDATVAHEHLDPRIDYHLVTDADLPDCGFWILHGMVGDGTPTDRARAVKTDPLPHIGDYGIGGWIDANVMIRAPLDRYLDMVAAHPDIPVFGIPHPQRNCIYDEAQAVISHQKAAPDRVRAQMEAYSRVGYPRNHGLIETNFLIYNLRHPRIADIFTAWRTEVSSRTHRDQLSLNYVLWSLGLDWMPIMSEGRSLRAHPDFAYFGHGRNSGYRTPDLPAGNLAPRKTTKAA